MLQESDCTHDGISAKHIREAMRRLQREGVVESAAQKFCSFGSADVMKCTSMDDVEVISNSENEQDEGEIDKDGIVDND